MHTAEEEQDILLTSRGMIFEMKDMARELDWFDNKFVVLRAVKREILRDGDGLFARVGAGSKDNGSKMRAGGKVDRSF